MRLKFELPTLEVTEKGNNGQQITRQEEQPPQKVHPITERIVAASNSQYKNIILEQRESTSYNRLPSGKIRL